MFKNNSMSSITIPIVIKNIIKNQHHYRHGNRNYQK